MALFRRKPKPKPEPAPVPDVFVQHDVMLNGFTSRFFLVKDRLMTSSEEVKVEGKLILRSGKPLPSREAYLELRKQLFEALPVMGKDSTTGMIRAYPQYLAITWDESQLPEDEPYDVTERRLEEIVLGILTSHFGWNNPTIGHFAFDAERWATEKRLGANWQFGRYH